jgi:hypothetical protein
MAKKSNAKKTKSAFGGASKAAKKSGASKKKSIVKPGFTKKICDLNLED